ncbi:hypothetical protein JCM6882_003193 [Rhodosporidiobolus microsporus]
MPLTIRMLVSSLCGYVGLGWAVAAFIPLILTNAVKRRSGTGIWFLLVWLVADVLNLVGILKLGPQLTQIFLAIWYFVADFILAIELIAFGHSDWPAPPSKPTTNFLARQSRVDRPLWNRFCKLFVSFSVWDNIKLLATCTLLGLAWWGIYMLIGVYSKGDEFEIKAKTEISDLSFALGMAASATFAFARIPELVSGWRRSARNDQPEHSLDDPLFWILIGENVFNILSIFILSDDPKYLWHAELPWVVGGFVPIAFDAIILLSTIAWQRKWKNSPKGQAYDKQELKRLKVLDGIEEHKLHLQEEWAADDLRAEAGKHVPEVEKGKGFVEKVKEIRAKAAANAQKKVRKDYHNNLADMQKFHRRADERAQGLHGGSPFDAASNSNNHNHPLRASLSIGAKESDDPLPPVEYSPLSAPPYPTYPSYPQPDSLRSTREQRQMADGY